MRATTTVSTGGPLFNGQLERGIGRACEDARAEVGDTGVEMVRRHFDGVLRHDSWHYRSGRRTPGRLRAAVQSDIDGDRVKITNGNVIYRFWIEGVGKRNATTRFKGYRTFRLIRQRIRGLAPDVVRRHVAAAVRRYS